MDNNANEGTLGTLELCIDKDSVSISIGRFTELLKAEFYLDLTKEIYKESRSFDLQDRLGVLFGPLPKKDDAL